VDCQHIYNAHRQCQWCHRMRVDIETESLVAEVRSMVDEFQKLAAIPVTDPPRGLQVSRVHFDQWAERLEAAIPAGM
jgi:hypothetical protein